MSSAGWAEYFTQDGTAYYYNSQTEETSWDKPDAMKTEDELQDTGDWVWAPHESEGYVCGQITNEYHGGDTEVTTENGEVVVVSKKEKNRITKALKGSLKKNHADLVQMDEISEPMIQNNLRLRFNNDQIYTNIGTILISVNPFKRLPLYTPSVIDDYIHKGKRDMPPHVFNIAEAAFTHLVDDKQDQSILISGESGAGKTEATKQCLMFFAECAGSANGVEQNILLSNPILEAFGNAKTLRNNNSSRFGKLISILFDGRARITGATIINYLLEKSRVVYQLEGERSFHIFYQLLTGADADLKQKFALWGPLDYYYISQSGCTTADGIDDMDEWNEMIEAMNKMGFVPEERENVFRLVSAVLHLGNIDFQPGKSNLRTETCEVMNQDCLDICADLLQVTPGDLKAACTNRTMIVRGQAPTKIPLDHEKASDNRNSFAKKIYSHMFDWIVTRVNVSMAPPKNAVRTGAINVLDIFGFEIFEVNSFEQLCINFCNEKLQQHFNQHTFKLEEQLYKREQIKFDHVEFIDNQPVLDMIEMKPKGILVVLDEEIVVPKGSDTTFLNKINKHHGPTPHFKEVRTSKSEFIVCHYAGEVLYDVYSFLEKNKDTLTKDLYDLIGTSRLAFLKTIFPNLEESAGGRKVSLGAQFRRQLDDLMKTLNQTEPHYIRCVKPNDNKRSGEFKGLMCLQQLRYAGVFEAVKIRQQGFPFRYTHEDFVKRYGFMRPEVVAKHKQNYKSACKDLIAALKGKFEAAQIGNTRVLYRAFEHRQFELLRNLAVEKQSIIMQAYMRRWATQRKAQVLFKLKPVLQQAINSRNLEQIKAAIAQYKNVDWDIKEVIDARRLRDVIELEIDITNRLNNFVNQNHEQVYDQMKKATEEAAEINFSSDLVKKCTDIVYNITERRDCRKLLQAATSDADRSVLEEQLARAQSLGMTVAADPIMKAAQTEVERIKKEEQLVAKVEQECAQGFCANWDHTTINWQGLEQAVNAASSFGCRTANGKRKVIEGGLLVRIRQALWNEDWPGLGPVLKECVSQTPAFTNDEVSNAQEELSHKVAVDDVLARLTQAIAEHDQDELAYALEQAQRLGMEQPEVYEGHTLLNNIVQARQMLQNGIQNVDQQQLDDALQFCATFNYQREEMPEGQRLLAEIVRLKKELATGLHYMEKPIIEKAMEESEAIRLEWDKMEEARGVLAQSEEKFLQLQLKTANQLHDPARAIRIMIQMKELFFASHGKLFTFKTYGNLRPADQYAKAALLGRDKLRINMLVWTKSPIPTSLTFLPPLFAKQSTKLFKNILGYMGDRSMSYPDQLAQDLLNQGLATPEVRDEIYCQLIKQMTQNPNPQSTQKGWKLMELCLQTFAPGDDFANYLEMYLRGNHGQDREKNKYVLMLHDTQYGPKKTSAPNVETLERQNDYTPFITLDVQTEIDPSKVKVADLDAMKAALPPGVGGPPGGGGFAAPAAAASSFTPPAQAAAAAAPVQQEGMFIGFQNFGKPLGALLVTIFFQLPLPLPLPKALVSDASRCMITRLRTIASSLSMSTISLRSAANHHMKAGGWESAMGRRVFSQATTWR